ncbi:hypothetical protein REPUB_Repub12eG0216700 [Reevesia pubescens]
MATLLSSPPSLLSSSSAKTPQPKPPQPNYSLPFFPKPLPTALTIALATTSLLTSSPSIAAQPPTYHLYYGTAASAANYGGYGGNSDKKASTMSRTAGKSGTNGTDSEFYIPKKRQEKEYLTFLAGFRQLAPKDVILNNLALSDVELQDLIAGADSLESQEKKDENGQLYYAYEIDGIGKHSLIAVTCAKNKLYAHFVNAPAPEWKRDEETLRHIHDSFKTVGSS